MENKELIKEFIATIEADMEEMGFEVHNNNDTMTTIEIETDTVPVDVVVGIVAEEDGFFVHVEGANFYELPEKMSMSLFVLLNEMNSESIFVKYSTNYELNQVTVAADAMVYADTCVKTCRNLIARVAAGAEYCYPILQAFKSKK
ncbi:hypothetical protein SAMN04487830_1394 [Pseudobutyrivibrio sp. OR37]|uniref:hypothetical protein n=1 Tax=Pseudobutyrivibrio sp. OR37 TaxID=1798186 RepID=UPI0008E5721E|nr:hypothetical protein [Pseudobutyrivibrio sp. OR37]SFI29752.1 hypothetical protein SAMN04487830_1394 [Pseudobutyrivibrio sp. OR37]